MNLFVSFAWTKPDNSHGFGDLLATNVREPVNMRALNEIREKAEAEHGGATISILSWKQIDE